MNIQMNLAESRSLIRSVLSKYQYKFNTPIKISLISIIKAAKLTPSDKKEDGPYFVYISSRNLVESLNKILVEIDKKGGLESISKKSGSPSTYKISNGSRIKLFKYLDIDVND